MRVKTVHKPIIGIDEVGRGSLAGPVTVAAVFLPKKFNFRGLKDSKKLTPWKREDWFKRIKEEKEIFYAYASISPKIIDAINIRNATNLAATVALERLLLGNSLRARDLRVFLDGGLKVDVNPKIFMRAIIRGDEKIEAIKIASIIAKVTRDRFMVKMHEKYPKYGFNRNKGYGTQFHINAILKEGATKIHRLTFLNNYVTLN